MVSGIFLQPLRACLAAGTETLTEHDGFGLSTRYDDLNRLMARGDVELRHLGAVAWLGTFCAKPLVSMDQAALNGIKPKSTRTTTPVVGRDSAYFPLCCFGLGVVRPP